MTINLEELKERLIASSGDGGNTLYEDSLAAIEQLQATIAKQARSAKMGMDAAKSSASSMLTAAEKARAESSPDALASERAANAALTMEVEQLQADKERLERENEELRSVWEDPAKLHATLLSRGYDRMNALHLAGATDYDQIKRELEEAREDAEIGAILLGEGFYDRMSDLDERDTAERVVAAILARIDPILQKRFARKKQG